MPYTSEEAFRVGLSARITRTARESRWSRDEVARAVAVQVFLARLFRSDDTHRWLLVGGTGLQYRVPDIARPTSDADLAVRLESEEMAAALHAAAEPLPGEYGRFALTLESTRAPGMYQGQITYLLSEKRVAVAGLDVTTGRDYLLPPDLITPGPVVAADGIPAMPAIPVVSATEALADKVAAMYELHGSAGITAPEAQARPDVAHLLEVTRPPRSTIESRPGPSDASATPPPKVERGPDLDRGL